MLGKGRNKSAEVLKKDFFPNYFIVGILDLIVNYAKIFV